MVRTVEPAQEIEPGPLGLLEQGLVCSGPDLLDGVLVPILKQSGLDVVGGSQTGVRRTGTKSYFAMVLLPADVTHPRWLLVEHFDVVDWLLVVPYYFCM